MLKTKITSSLEKVFLDNTTEDFPALEKIGALRGERLSFQLVYRFEDAVIDTGCIFLKATLEGALGQYAKIYAVKQLPVTKPVYPDRYDDAYIKTEPGLYPDLLEPMSDEICFKVTENSTDALWIELNIPDDENFSGEYPLTLTVFDEKGEKLTENTISVEVIPATLPEQKLIFTQWFYCDCLAQYYKVPVWSKRHFEIIENFAKMAVSLGINTLLTPVFTPPLDTAVGGERLTTQLVKIKKRGEKYTFSWTLLDKWIDMCDRVGIKNLEISHLFTQWGATHAPKIIAEVDGEEKRIFGWETDAHGEEYRKFIREFLSAFISHMKKRGDDKRCFFHISDEPTEEQLEDYGKSKSIVSDILDGYVIMDALSSYEFFEKGIVKTPIPANDHIKPFIENNVKNLWTYYCCVQCLNVSNRLVAMPSCRNRSIGMQMYKYNIVGFLHWGYNFYCSQYSIKEINPYLELSGEKWVPAGDPFSVYPAKDGTAHPSLRAIVFFDALQDMRAMQLCESLYSHDEVVGAIEEALGFDIEFDKCAKSAAEILRMRETINAMIKAKTAK